MLDDPIIGKFNLSMKKYNKLFSQVCIAVSGGSDSIALCLLALNWVKYDKKRSIIAVTFDHQIRKDSLLEAQKVNEFLTLHGIKHFIISWENKDIQGNLLEQAREARYEYLSDFCKRQKTDCVMIGHTMQDQAETVLMRVLRGSGVDGLSSMQEKFCYKEVSFLRPMLDITRDELKNWLVSKKIDWIEDPTNNNIKYDRIKVRKFIESQRNKDEFIVRLSNTSKYMRETRNFVEKHCKLFWQNNVVIDNFGCGYIDRSAFIEEDKVVSFRVLSKLLRIISAYYYPPRSKKLINLYESIICDFSKEKECFKARTLGGCYIFYRKKDNKIVLLREEKVISSKIDKIKNGSRIIWDNRYYCDVSKDLGEGFEISNLGPEGFRAIKEDLDGKYKEISKKILYTIPAFKKEKLVIAVPLVDYYKDYSLKGKLTCVFYKYEDFDG